MFKLFYNHLNDNLRVVISYINWKEAFEKSFCLDKHFESPGDTQSRRQGVSVLTCQRKKCFLSQYQCIVDSTLIPDIRIHQIRGL